MTADETIVLVGGLGTRLRAVVSDVPKPLAPVAGRPFLAWVLDHLEQAGMRRAILATGFMAEKVEQAIGRRWGRMAVDYSFEERPLGTGGAIRQAARMLQSEGVHVVNGDTFLRYSPAALERRTLELDASIGIALAHVPDVGRYGAVELAGGRVSAFREKGQHGAGDINAGCYFLTAGAVGALPEREAFSLESDVMTALAAAGKIAALTDTADFIDIGVPEDFFRAQTQFAVAS